MFRNPRGLRPPLKVFIFFSHRSNSLFNGGTFWRFSRLMMLHVPRTRSMTNWASICGLRCNQKENRNTHHTVGPTGIDVEHHLQGNYDTRTTIDEIFCLFSMKTIQNILSSRNLIISNHFYSKLKSQARTLSMSIPLSAKHSSISGLTGLPF